MAAVLRLAGVLAIGIGLACWGALPPSPAPAEAPPTQFSAGRARADLGWIAAAPHPTGSVANEHVRAHLIARLAELGLTAELQHAEEVPTQHRDRPAATVTIDNVIARLPGRDASAPAIALMCHYDSVPTSPGAADDGAGVAAILEIARVLKARAQPLPRDLVLLFSDGEELGLLGALQFFAHHPLAKRVGAVVNLEARGGAGRAFLFETGAASDELVRALAAAYPRATSTSFATFVYDRMPNGTDFTVPKRAGLAGLNFAFIADPRQYHTMLATPEALDLGSLQHLGEQALASVDVMEARGPEARDGAALAWSDLLGRRLVVYGPTVGWALVGAAALLVLIASVRLARRAAPVRIGTLLRGPLFLVAVAAAAAVLLFAAGLLASAPRTPEHVARLFGACLRFELALACVGAGVLLSIARVGAVDRDAAWIGLLLTAAIAAVALQSTQPRLAPPLAWPLLLAAAGTIAIGSTSALGSAWSVLTGGAALALTLAWAHAVYLAIGVFLPPALVPFLLCAAVAAFPILVDAGRGRVGRSLAVLLVGVGLGLALSVRLAG